MRAPSVGAAALVTSGRVLGGGPQVLVRYGRSGVGRGLGIL